MTAPESEPATSSGDIEEIPHPLAEAEPRQKGKGGSREGRKAGRKRASHGGRGASRVGSWPAWIRVPVLFLILLYSPPMLFNVLSAMGAHRSRNVTVYGYPLFVYTFPMILLGLLFSLLVTIGVSPGLLGWTYLIVIVYTFLTLGFDFHLGSWVLISALSGFVIVCAAFLGTRYNVPVFGALGDFLARFGLEFPRSFVLPFSVILLLLYLLMMFLRHFRKVLKVRGNFVIVTTVLGDTDRNTRTSYSLNTSQPDINELILGGAITLTLDPKSPRVTRHEFRNVPGGHLVSPVIEELLQAVDVEEAGDEDQIDDDDDDLDS